MDLNTKAIMEIGEKMREAAERENQERPEAAKQKLHMLDETERKLKTEVPGDQKK